MKSPIVALTFACLISAVTAGDLVNTLTDAEKSDSWFLLFDGRDAKEKYENFKFSRKLGSTGICFPSAQGVGVPGVDVVCESLS